MNYTDDGLERPRQHRAGKPTHTPEQLDAFAAKADSDQAESLLEMATRAANAILDVQGTFTVVEVRIALQHAGLLSNDGTENLNALGSLGRRMGCRSTGIIERATLKNGHGKLQTRWRRPTHDEMAAEGLLP